MIIDQNHVVEIIATNLGIGAQPTSLWGKIDWWLRNRAWRNSSASCIVGREIWAGDFRSRIGKHGDGGRYLRYVRVWLILYIFHSSKDMISSLSIFFRDKLWAFLQNEKHHYPDGAVVRTTSAVGQKGIVCHQLVNDESLGNTSSKHFNQL